VTEPLAPAGRSIFLVGFMGSGKSTVGRIVADRLSRPFVDTDERVVAREGRTIEQIFAREGEGYFRAAEWDALREIAASPPPVVATGGGLFLGSLQRRWLRARGLTVWLDASLAACRTRVALGGGRPLWLERADSIDFRVLFERRRAVYALADLRLPADGSGEGVARDLLQRLAPG
jgi:shikimate kinase